MERKNKNTKQNAKLKKTIKREGHFLMNCTLETRQEVAPLTLQTCRLDSSPDAGGSDLFNVNKT
jgi:hypothetical protein